jgi:YidC/Oxa1 family membrane protein insertase
MNTSRFGNLRVYLWAALAMLLLYDYQIWMRDYAPPPGASAGPAATAPQAPSAGDLGNRVPQGAPGAPAAPTLPGAATGTPAAPAPAGAVATAPPEVAAVAAAPVVRVRTDVLDVDISTRGGTLVRVELLAYPRV